MSSAIKQLFPLDFQWPTLDPFLFCAHHKDHYPAGNDQLGPDASLSGRRIGQDFTLKNGWRMYHGQQVPGFPAHPHRGFETITVVTEGLIDHSDSLGAAGRYGGGDTQWMTAGKGVQHSEMFPCVNPDQPNPLELFQIWLNLPARSKLCEPHFKMLWREEIPKVEQQDTAGHRISVDVIAGSYAGVNAVAPPPESWAYDDAHRVAVWTIVLDPDAEWTLPAEQAGLNRALYFYQGRDLSIDDTQIKAAHGIHLSSDQTVTLKNGSEQARLVLLQGKPIAEPVVQYGPFVMNTEAEIRQTFHEYQQTEFGGWPWPNHEHTHGRKGRFAQHADGFTEEK